MVYNLKITKNMLLDSLLPAKDIFLTTGVKTKMAKGTFKILDESHPIFKEGLRISSGNSNRELMKSTKPSQKNTDGKEMNQSTQTTQDKQT